MNVGIGGARLDPKASRSLPAPQSGHAPAITFFANFSSSLTFLADIHHRVILHLSSTISSQQLSS